MIKRLTPVVALAVLSACANSAPPGQIAFDNAMSVALMANSLNQEQMPAEDIVANADCIVETASAAEANILSTPAASREQRQQLIDTVVAISKRPEFDACLELA